MSAVTPKGLMWTYEDYANLPEDGLRHEIIHGKHFVNPSPSTQHQHVSKRLQYQLYTKIELAGLGLLYNAPIDDRTIKKDLYERSGVVEYWIVNPFEQQVEQWILRDGKYLLAAQAKVIRLTFVSDVEVDFDSVW